MMFLDDVVAEYANSYLDNQSLGGYFPAGHNGPYMDPEKATRNTAHILFMLASVYESKPSDEIKNSAERAIEYLLSKEARPYSASFHCRDKDGKDHCNGLVGQAWVIEALVKAAKVFNRPDCYKVAEEVYLLHKFNESIGLWHRLEIDGTTISFDSTFNHQLWFAAAAAQLSETPIAKKQALIFINKVISKVKLYDNGVIYHNSSMGNSVNYLSLSVKKFLGQIKFRFFSKKNMPGLYSKSVGYHGFNLYAFSILKSLYPNDEIWSRDIIKRAISVVDTDGFLSELKKSEYGYYYNLSGIEIAYAIEVFLSDKVKVQKWLDRQFYYTSESSHLLTKDVIDKNTALARMYQLTRIKGNYKVSLDGK